MTVSTPSFRSSYSLLRYLPGLGLVLAAIAAVLLALAPIGWRAGWWPLRFSFLILMPAAGYVGVAAIAVSVLALFLRRAAIDRRGALIAVIGIIVGGSIAYMPVHYRMMHGKYPPIDDITTDTENPPVFMAAVAPRRAEHENPTTYGGAKIAEQQKRTYPDIGPLNLAVPTEQAFARALDTAQGMGWTIVDGNPVTGRIEAYDRSPWFGFTDDIVIQIVGSGVGSRVDMRSSSRLGRGDFGVDAARIRAYLAELR
jgi:uncharacterized protein (DUF1499 family)